MKGIFKAFYSKEKARLVLITTYIFGLAAHGFGLMNVEFSHDSLYNFMDVGTEWQLSLGRFLQPVYLRLRDSISAPLLVGLIAFFFIACAAYLVIDLFGVENRLSVIFICAIMVANATVTSNCSTYIPWFDIFMLSLLLSCLAAWVLFRFKYGFIASGVLIFLSMGFYQAYITTFVTLVMLYSLLNLAKTTPLKQTIFGALKGVGAAAIGGAVYAVAVKVVLALNPSISLWDGENGLASTANFSGVSIVELVNRTYRFFISYFGFSNRIQELSIIAANLLLIAVAVALLFFLTYKNKQKPIKYVLEVVILLLLPLGANAIYIISKGWVHDLMIFSFVFVLIFGIVVFEECFRGKPKSKLSSVSKAVVVLCCLGIVFNNIISSNQLYLKKKLVYDSTMSMVNRVIYSIEDTENYCPLETPVIFVGSLDSNPLVQSNYSEFNADTYFGSIFGSSVTYSGTMETFMKYVMNESIYIEDFKSGSDLSYDDMPAFPQKGYCAQKDGKVIVKLSN